MVAGSGVVWPARHPIAGGFPQAAKSAQPSRVASINLASDRILLDLAPEKLVAVSAIATASDASPDSEAIGGRLCALGKGETNE